MANNNNKNESLEKQLWKAADKLRKNIDAAEYKHIVLGLTEARWSYLQAKAKVPEIGKLIDFEERFSKLKTDLAAA